MRFLTTIAAIMLSGASAQALAQNNANTALTLSTQALNQQNVATQRLNQQSLQVQAQEWGLTTEEWMRYEALKQGERGVWSPNLDPLTMLGIEAKSPQEQERYAKLLAKRMYERIEKEIAFQKAYDKAFAELYPGQLPFNVEPHISQRFGRVIYFTRLDNCDKCDDDASRVLSYVNEKTPIDIYFVGTKNNEQIYAWAKKHKIDPVKVNQRLITLNHDNGTWLQYGEGKMPGAFQVQGDGQWQKIVY